MELRDRGLPYVLARRGNASGGWAPAEAAFTFREATQNVPRSAWQAVQRRFRDGHVEVWWAAELTLAAYGPGERGRAVCATTDRNTLPEISTWYLTTNLTREQAPLSEIVRLYGLRNWVEQSYKQMKDELGWADFRVRKDHVIRRHWELVCCAFVFCWWYADCRRRVNDEMLHPDRMLYKTCRSMARSSFSGAMLGRPPLMSASYIAVNRRSIFTSASLAICRIERNGWDFGTKSSKRRMVNRLPVKESAPRIDMSIDVELAISRLSHATRGDGKYFSSLLGEVTR